MTEWKGGEDGLVGDRILAPSSARHDGGMIDVSLFIGLRAYLLIPDSPFHSRYLFPQLFLSNDMV